MGNHRIAGGRWRVDAPDFRCRDPCGESARRPLGSPAGHGPEHSGRRSTLVAPSARPHVPTSTTHGRTDSGLGLAWERHWDRESRGTRHTRSRRHRTEVRARGQSSESQRPERGARPLKPPTRRAPTRRRSGAVGAERVDVHVPARGRACGDWCAVSTKKYHQTVISHIRHGLYYVNAGAASVESSDGETQREIGVEAAGRLERGCRTHL